jgi:hypothetical protein
MPYVSIFQGKNGDTIAPQYYVISTFPLLLIIDFAGNNLASTFILRTSGRLFRCFGHTAKTFRLNLHIPDMLQMLKAYEICVA